jgi:MFS family permease/tetratricopeptide (TPR) repeat protein
MVWLGGFLSSLNKTAVNKGFPVFVAPVRDGFGASNAAVSFIFSLARAESGPTGPIAGWFIDRFGPRRALFVGALMSGGGFLALGYTTSLRAFGLLYLLVVTAGANLGFSYALSTLINNWFYRRKALAMSAFQAVDSFLPAMLVGVVALAIAALSWQTTAKIIGIVLLVVILPLAFFIKDAPESMGLTMDGDAPGGSQEPSRPLTARHTRWAKPAWRPPEEYSLRQTLRSWAFWNLTGGTALRLIAKAGVTVHIIPIMASKGVSERTAAFMFGLQLFLTVPMYLLLGWDKAANRYDLHPIVRGVVWQALDARARRDIYGALHGYFDAAPRPPAWENVESLEDLTPGVELFHTLIGLERYEDAYVVFRDHLDHAMHFRLSANRQRAELLERLFPDGVDTLPRLASARRQGYTLNALALAYQYSGEPGRAEPLYRRAVEIDERQNDWAEASVVLGNLSDVLRLSGHLRAAETAACRALGMCREQGHRIPEGISLHRVGLALAACGAASPSAVPLCRSLNIWVAQKHKQLEGAVNTYLAQRCLWLSQPGEALPLAQRAWELAHVDRVERDFIRAARLHGEAALGLGDLSTASDRLHHALPRARAVNVVEEELPALTALAELHRRQQHYDAACELLDQVWTPADRGPYPLIHADALNVLAQIERDQGRREAAVAAATEAYKQAWCDGPPYAYHFGLSNARSHLRELGAPEPELPPFDPSKYAPIPEVELDPEDEFHVGDIPEA